MRRKRKNRHLAPFAAGLTAGYASALAVCAAAAAVINLADADFASGAAAILALAAGSFVCGRTAGAMRGFSGLKTGIICGIIFLIPPAVLSAVFGRMGGVMLAVKAAVCICFGAAGGVVGVNREENIG